MRLSKADFLASFLIFVASIFFVFDLFLTPARMTSFDIPFHAFNMAQFFLALKGGDFPVVWTDGIANYGLPMSIVAHQLTSYLGAILIFTISDTLLSLKIISFVGIFLSSIFFYLFARIYFNPVASFAGTYLYTFSSYKIINFYIRGAMPEIFSAIFLPLILIGMYLFIKRRNFFGLVLLALSFFLLALNHPMMLLIYAFVYLPYLLFMIFFDSEKSFNSLTINSKIKNFLSLLVAVLIGVASAGYYLIPLNLEIKYFYYGQIRNHLTPDSFLGVFDLMRFNWEYFTPSEIITRGHIIFPGIIEILGVAIGILFIFYKWLVKKQRKIGLIEYLVVSSILVLIFTTPIIKIAYEKINILSNIQFPWRMLSAFIFFPPLIYAYIFSKLNKNIFVLIFLIIVSVLQFPQIYGKNYLSLPKNYYFFSEFNPHSVLMNTIWSGKSEDYPIKRDKIEVIEGESTILEKEVSNSSRNYTIDAKTTSKLVDYTFYFPGWNVYVDGKMTPIEFQNPTFRGLITYQIDPGSHNVELKFEDTRVRLYSKAVSIAAFIFFIFSLIFRKRIYRFLKLEN